ncbi:MAG: 1-aminocyclopropane-1-carboxylate deaminase [Campylobacterota bacterium]|nr:1-aminocyclopropane-1-carboxylate deaminase [Campylobacterota bacterium]
MQNITNSPIDKITFNDTTFLIKRDDLLHKEFTGNKARKFYYYFKNDFLNIDTIISHGSNQSNAMYSLSVLAKLKCWNFIYYTNHIPSFLEQNPQGNYKYALENGMQIIVDENFDYSRLKIKNSQLFISEGGAVKEASFGLEILANEIKEYQNENNIKNLKIFLPSGTGTTALFLQKYLRLEVLTCPCVGDSEYLKKQFLELESDENKHPTIVKPRKKYHFGKLYKDNYILYKELKKQTNIEFDLLYDPIGIETFLNYSKLKSENSTLLYIHQGGIIGNETMISRYLYKWKDLDVN